MSDEKRKHYSMFTFILFLLATNCQQVLSVTKSVGKPWPLPQVYKPTSDTLTVASSRFRFTPTGQTCDILEDALDRYFRLIFGGVSGTGTGQSNVLRFWPWLSGLGMMVELKVNVFSPCEKYPSLHMDESYKLKVSTGSGSLTANSVWGALRGLETFSQLIYEAQDGQLQVNVTYIDDYPRFTWRGILLDTNGHFLPKPVLLRNLDAMSYNKMNVFHWHIVDLITFPYQSRLYPELSEKGAFTPYTHAYSQEDIAEIIEYARMRGIRVVPEFDTPGHCASWGKSHPELLTKCFKEGKADGYGPMNPILNTTYDLLRGLMKEVTEVFPDHYLHLGGDEVDFDCWKSNPNITKFMNRSGFGKNYAKLEEYYFKRLHDIVSSYNSGQIVWQEVFDNDVELPTQTIIEVWKEDPYQVLDKVTARGYQAIYAHGWYLQASGLGNQWSTCYQNDPLDFKGTPEQKQLVLGGEASIWTFDCDATTLEPKLWPQASGVAERLWTAPTVMDLDEAAHRIEEHRCRMLYRGINASPPNTSGFCKYEAGSYPRHLAWKY